MFSVKEINYLRTQLLARIATVSTALQPDVAPVGFDFDGTYFYVGGLAISRTLKYKNVQVNPKLSLVIDDLETSDPWMPRGVKTHGTADLVSHEGYMGVGTYIRITPTAKWSWGIEAPTFQEGQPQYNTDNQV
ncbi:MAG: PPOX class F420-dependent oxidoreductase [Blastochloris sp.]|nr:PPOX class F420-dependent oxidoreductase [Blastochloris sp.]